MRAARELHADKPRTGLVMKLVTTSPRCARTVRPGLCSATEAYALGPTNDGVLEATRLQGLRRSSSASEQFWLLRQLRDKACEIRRQPPARSQPLRVDRPRSGPLRRRALRPYNVGPDALW